MSEWIDILGNQDFYCAGRYKYGIGKGKEKTLWGRLEFGIEDMNYFISVCLSVHLSIYLYHLSMYICSSSLSSTF